MSNAKNISCWILNALNSNFLSNQEAGILQNLAVTAVDILLGVQCLIKIKQFLYKVFLLNKMKSLIEKLEKCFSVFMKES